jgi:hypothetical protein
MKRFCPNHPTVECLADYATCAVCWDQEVRIERHYCVACDLIYEGTIRIHTDGRIHQINFEAALRQNALDAAFRIFNSPSISNDRCVNGCRCD